MIALFIGGTGTISMAITRLAASQGWKLYLLNRGNRPAEDIPAGVEIINADIYNESDVAEKIKGMQFDVVCDFIVFHSIALERDYRLFKGKTKQFMYISSASAYQKPLSDYRITEGTPVIVHGDGTSLWTMTFNTDFARGCVGLMGNVHAIGELRGVRQFQTQAYRVEFSRRSPF